MADHRDFAEFYAASFHRLTAQLYLHCGDLSEAQDVVQEELAEGCNPPAPQTPSPSP